MADVQIFIPVFDGLPFLRETLASAAAQRDVSLEIVVMDNASTDGTSQFLQEAAAVDARITVLRHDTNLGMIGNFNACLDAVSAPYFMLLCSDDLLREPDAVKQALDVLEDDPEAASVYCDLQYVDRAGRLLSTRRFKRGTSFDTVDALRGTVRTNRNLFGIPLLHRTSVCGSLRYPDDQPYAFDVYLSAQIGARGGLRHIPQPLIANRYTGQNATVSLLWDTRKELLAVAQGCGLKLGRMDRALSYLSQIPVSLAKLAFFQVVRLRRLERENIRLARYIRFGVVGLFNTAFGYGVYLALLWMELPYQLAWGGSLVLSLLVGFKLSGKLVFGEAGSKSLVLYVASWAGIYLLNIAILGFLVGLGIPATLAPLLLLPLNVLLSYLSQRFLVFPEAR